MPAATLDQTTPLPLQQCHHGDPALVHRSACYLEGQGEPIFAWLHQPDKNLQDSLDHGIVICPPVGYEQLHAHRALRHLADSFASAQIPTLRFDWHGTGDSPGHDEDPERYRTWLNNVSDAATWMRQQLGCRHVSAVGLRLGATLAVLAAEHTALDRLVLWSPVVKGRSYVREMRALGLTSEAPVRASTSLSSDIESGGFLLSSQTAAELGSIDLLKTAPKCGGLLIVSRSDLPEDNRLSQHYAQSGLPVQQIACPGYTQMMVEPHRNAVPQVAIDQITEWIRQAVSTDAKSLVECDAPATDLTTVTMTVTSFGSNPTEVSGQIRESTLRLSSRNAHLEPAIPLRDARAVDACATPGTVSSPDLFGIVSEPTTGVAGTLPTIVLLNSGSAYRIGASRLNVLLARHLAVLGFRCLRMDLSGLGDSMADSPDAENDSYSATMFRDIEVALQQMEGQFGASRFVLMGLCSGAYAAFQSAVQIGNPALIEALLINPLTYFWTEGMTLETSATKHLMSFHHYQAGALDPKKWWKLLTGKSKLGITGALKLVGRRLGLIKPSRPANSFVRAGNQYPGMITHPVREDLPGDLHRIQQANRHLAMFFSRSDPGFSILNCHARRKANQLRKSGRLSVNFIDESDHTFTLRLARADLIQAVSNHLRQRYC